MLKAIVVRKFGLLVFLMVPLYAYADDLFLSVKVLSIRGIAEKKVCQSQVSHLKALDLTFDGMMGLLIVGTTPTQLHNCDQYLAAGIGAVSVSRMETWTEHRIYEQTCGTLFALERARKPMASYLGANPIALSLLPPTVLPSVTRAQEEELELVGEGGATAATYLKRMRKADRKAFLDGWKITLLARSDFDGDGVEDALVAISYSPPGPEAHYFSGYLGVIERTSKGGLSKFIPFNEFSWSAPNPTFQRTAPPPLN